MFFVVIIIIIIIIYYYYYYYYTNVVLLKKELPAVMSNIWVAARRFPEYFDIRGTFFMFVER